MGMDITSKSNVHGTDITSKRNVGGTDITSERYVQGGNLQGTDTLQFARSHRWTLH